VKYRTFFAIAVLCFVTCAILSWLHIDEDNSPLIFGFVFLGISALASPLILSWAVAKDSPVKPSFVNILRSIIFPLAGLFLLGWGILGAIGVVPAKSFDGQRQHCRACGVTWVFAHGRIGPHYLERCSRCATLPGLADEAASMARELIERVNEDHDVRPESATVNRSPVGVSAAYWIDAEVKKSRRFTTNNYGAPEQFRLEIDGAAEGAGFRLTLRLSLVDVASNRALDTVERTRTFPIEAAPKPGALIISRPAFHTAGAPSPRPSKARAPTSPLRPPATSASPADPS
jgi:hypothetical protein